MSDALLGDISWQFAKNPVSMKEALQLCTQVKDEGNKCFKGEKFDR